MAVFRDTVLTVEGRKLLSEALATKKQIEFTRVIATGESFKEVEDTSQIKTINNINQSVNISDITQDNTKVIINAIFTNKDLEEEYRMETIALFAKLYESENEILYSITVAEEADTMPAKNSTSLATVGIDLITEINNSNGATIVMNPSTLVTHSALEKYAKKVDLTALAGKQNGKFPLSSATKGNVYLLEQTQKFYVCTADYNGTTISVPNSNFTELSVYENMNRLENLVKISDNLYKIGNIVFERVNIVGDAGTKVVKFASNLKEILSINLTSWTSGQNTLEHSSQIVTTYSLATKEITIYKAHNQSVSALIIGII